MAQFKAVFLEGLMVALIGIVVALIANAISPLGLRLGRNYFPSATVTPGIGSTPVPVTGNPNDATAATLKRLQEHGLQVASSNEVVELFRDSRYQQGLIVFVDARDDQHYHDGHVPAAWQFNHYRAEQFLPAVLPVCLGAQKVIVYCTGGACEDSEFAAVMLRDAGVPRENVYVYVGGITEWVANGLPVETGARGSGQMKGNSVDRH